MNRKMKSLFFIIALLLILLIGMPAISNSATMGDYCAIPPFVQMDIEPNIMLFLDTSCDMSGPAYHYPTEDPTAPQPRYYATSGSISVAFSDTANTITRSAGSFITDGFAVGDKIETNSANANNRGPFKISAVTATVISVTTTTGGSPTLTSGSETCTITTRNSYIGLFESDLFYVWNSTNNEWRIAAIQPILPSPLPSGCYNDTSNDIGESTMSGATPDPSFKYTQCCGDYTCKDNAATPKRYFKGSFMNFITSSRYDVMMRILVGGYGSADGSGQIKRFETYAALPCTASCNTDADCPAGQRCEVVKGKKQCSAGESEWEWVDPVTHCEFEIERESNEFEFEIEGEGDGAQVCTITGKSEIEIETTGANASMYIAVDRYSDNNAVPSGIAKTTGLVQEYYDRAHWGSATIKSSNPAQTAIGNCLSLTNPTVQSFVNGITAPGNTPASLAKVTLATAYAGIIDYFKYNGAASYTGCTGGTKDPFYNDTVPCRKNFVLLLSSAYATGGTDYDAAYVCPSPTDCDSSVVGNNCSEPLVKNSCYAFEKDLRDGTAGMGTNVSGKQNLYDFGVFTMGADYENTDGCTSTTSPDNPCRKTNKGIFSDAANAGGGKSEGNQQFFAAPTPSELEQAIRDAINAILRRVTSGTAASVLASGEGSGANLVQAVYYPKRRFFDTSISWVGGLQNLWYYVDPYFTNSNIREETTVDSKLNLQNDYIAQLYFDTTEQKARSYRFIDSDGDGDADSQTTTVDFESLGHLWEAGKLLWNRDLSPTASPRAIYTPLDTSQALTANANKFSTANVSTLRPLLGTDNAGRTSTQNDTVATNLINYIHGYDLADYTDGVGTESYRTRTVSIDLNDDGDVSDTVTVQGVSMSESAKVWKLGDIIDSTPRIASWVQLNAYDTAYGDPTYGSFLATTGSTGYTERGMVFSGANDGMLHAFKLGKLELAWTGQGTFEKAKLTNPDPTTPLGQEMWAFIPKNTLPYLKYLKDTNYCHIYSIDLSPYLFDASIEKPAVCGLDYWRCDKTVDSWRTILIGGMRMGGACRNSGTACNSKACSVTTSTSCTGDSDCPSGEKCLSNCVNTPASGNGYSSYFALDVTDQNNPKFLWEFSDPGLGFTTTGPSVVKITSRDGSGNIESGKNDRWFVVFGSGPTGPIDTARQQFLGRSDQNLKLFILDLKGPGTGSWTENTNYWVKDTGVQNAFAGSMLNSTHDSDFDYQDDAVYIPYVKKCVTGETTFSGDAETITTCGPVGTWTNGGVLRLLTKDEASTSLTPSNWVLSKVIDNIGPVTSSVVRLQNRNTGKLWLYFGTGRYYYKQSAIVDDADNQRLLFGITDPCFSSSGFNSVCLDGSTANDPSPGGLSKVDLASEAGVTDTDGWYIKLDATASPYYAERIITDPLSTSVGVVFFTAFKPYTDECSIGGKSAIWAVKYDTGGAAGSLLKGKALIQVSTGSIEQRDLSTAFTEKGGRRTSAMEGVPPTAQGLSLISSPPAVKRVLHIRER